MSKRQNGVLITALFRTSTRDAGRIPRLLLQLLPRERVVLGRGGDNRACRTPCPMRKEQDVKNFIDAMRAPDSEVKPCLRERGLTPCGAYP